MLRTASTASLGAVLTRFLWQTSKRGGSTVDNFVRGTQLHYWRMDKMAKREWFNMASRIFNGERRLEMGSTYRTGVTGTTQLCPVAEMNNLQLSSFFFRHVLIPFCQPGILRYLLSPQLGTNINLHNFISILTSASFSPSCYYN